MSGLSESERDSLCDAIMGYQHTMTSSAPDRFDRYVVPAVERILAARAGDGGLRAGVEALVSGEHASAILHGVVGTTPTTYGGVTKDEALDWAADLVRELRGLLGVDQ